MFNGSDIAPVRSGDWKKFLFVSAILMVGAAGALVFFEYDPTQVAFFPPCLFHQLTGLDCPGCGAQRALHQLLHGNIVAAVRLNAMFVVSLPLAAWFGARSLLRRSRGGPMLLNAQWLWVYLAAWLAFGVLRNLPFPIFQWFAP
jgi:hypothetical protein